MTRLKVIDLRRSSDQSICTQVEITMSSLERRAGQPVTFETGISAYLMGIDGTWRRDCKINLVSERGATLTIHGSIEGLNLKEFFLLLSATGLAYRRCELGWVNGEQSGVTLCVQMKKKIPPH
jgi:hypothetical protein